MKRFASSGEDYSSARKRSRPGPSRDEEDEDSSEEILVPRVARKRSAGSGSSARKMSKASTSRVEEDEDESSSEEMLDTFDPSQVETQDEETAGIKSEQLVNLNVSRPFT